MCTADNVRPKWREFDYEDKGQTAPDRKDWHELMWCIEYNQVEVGYFDGFTWRRWSGSDDFSVDFWAPMAWPSGPLPEAPDSHWDVDSEFYPEEVNEDG